MSGEFYDVNKDTLGHEADRLLRTVTRAFCDNVVGEDGDPADLCSIVLDALLRNHYHTPADDLYRLFGSRVNQRLVRVALGILVKRGLITYEERLHKSVELAAPKEKRKETKRGYTQFDYTNQQMQQTQIEAEQKAKERKNKKFYYVDYHRAIELIRYRMWMLLRDNEPVRAVYQCEHCQQQYSQEEYDSCMDINSFQHLCTCGGHIFSLNQNGNLVSKENLRRARFREALKPITNLLNEVMKKSYPPFDQYSPEEEKIIKQHNISVATAKGGSYGSTDGEVKVEEDLNSCPGALAKSVRVRNRAIPWLVHHGFFMDPEALPPPAKRANVSGDGKDNGALDSNQLSDDDKKVIRQIQSFDKYLQQRLEFRSPEDGDDVPDTVSIRSGSSLSADEQEVYSDMDVPSASSHEQQQQQQQTSLQEQMASVRVCRGFEEDFISSQFVFVGGEMRSLETLTVCDINRMNDDEYVAYANKVAILAGIS